MKHLLFLFTILWGSVIPLFGRPVVISNLSFLYANANQIEVSEISYGKDVTTVTFQTIRNADSTLKVGHGIYIVDDNGRRLHAIGTKGIKLDSLYILYEGQQIRFSVDFPAAAESNQALDIVDPTRFSFYGLHDASAQLNIPRCTPEIDPAEISDAFFLPAKTTVEGILHDSNDQFGQLLYCNYDPPRPYLQEEHSKFADISSPGRFSVSFTMYAPYHVDFRRYRLDVRHPLGPIYVRPGDNVFVEIFDALDGKETVYRNLSGGKAYNQLVNSPGFPFDYWKYHKNISDGFTDVSYPRHMVALDEDYHAALKFADYICWHYHLSSFETQLYLNELNWNYFFVMISSDIDVQNRYNQAKTDTERQKWGSLIEQMDYSYLKYINPNDPSTIYRHNNYVAGMVKQLSPLVRCLDKVPATASNRWQKVIDLQQEELNRITGWEGRTFFMELLIAELSYDMLQQKIGDSELEQIKSSLTHPYCRQLVDIYRQEFSEKKKSIL